MVGHCSWLRARERRSTAARRYVSGTSSSSSTGTSICSESSSARNETDERIETDERVVSGAATGPSVPAGWFSVATNTTPAEVLPSSSESSRFTLDCICVATGAKAVTLIDEEACCSQAPALPFSGGCGAVVEQARSVVAANAWLGSRLGSTKVQCQGFWCQVTMRVTGDWERSLCLGLLDAHSKAVRLLDQRRHGRQGVRRQSESVR